MLIWEKREKRQNVTDQTIPYIHFHCDEKQNTWLHFSSTIKHVKQQSATCHHDPWQMIHGCSKSNLQVGLLTTKSLWNGTDRPLIQIRLKIQNPLVYGSNWVDHEWCFQILFLLDLNCWFYYDSKSHSPSIWILDRMSLLKRLAAVQNNVRRPYIVVHLKLSMDSHTPTPIGKINERLSLFEGGKKKQHWLTNLCK